MNTFFVSSWLCLPSRMSANRRTFSPLIYIIVLLSCDSTSSDQFAHMRQRRNLLAIFTYRCQRSKSLTISRDSSGPIRWEIGSNTKGPQIGPYRRRYHERRGESGGMLPGKFGKFRFSQAAFWLHRSQKKYLRLAIFSQFSSYNKSGEFDNNRW